ncbi:hypothetical protein H6G33_03785 [Calothrix sp. FACHB-1219]|uniref:hypothetical protein n=1 Tax=unclassified Calothrix TaxID=2619626 RepID=UPI0016865C08|nr:MULTISPECIES: hypothetical protein [unclassified Calothrix]MBD2203023.1 hypothetical protein [Calothrix sp. FACHB-168]MBD2216151.1 hypothetical protein [Calothrix sp. FACHB-1219]
MSQTPSNIRFPQGRTAFLLIHGIGQQNPYETLDYFAQNFIKYFEQEKLPTDLEHHIARREFANGGRWIESFVRLSPQDATQPGLIDIHEYYWAPDTENKISVPEILQWAEQTLDGTIEFYNRTENGDLLNNLLENRHRQGWFKFRLRSLTIFLRIFNFIYPILRLLILVALLIAGPFLKGRYLQSAWKLSKKLIVPLLINFVGDVAIYTKTDPKSPYQKIRQQVITECLTLLQQIIKDPQAKYDQVIIVGHSLGSCIAYDTLNQLCIESTLAGDLGKSMDIDKLKGLVTFGSPLDKIAFFFRNVAQEQQYIRRRIIEHLNSFRIKPELVTKSTSNYLGKNPVVCQLEHISWINYYHLEDPISGHLDYYENLINEEMTYKTSWGASGHLGYWTDMKFYKSIAEYFLY